MFNASEHLITLKGKDYLQVAWRLVWFRQEHPDYGIDTCLLERDDEHAVFVTKITDETGRLICSGHGSECRKDFGDFTEKAETKSVGRALAMLGYGTQFVGDELDEGSRIVDSPVDRGSCEHVRCSDCGNEIRHVRMPTGLWSVDDVVDYSLENYSRSLCAQCLKQIERQAS